MQLLWFGITVNNERLRQILKIACLMIQINSILQRINEQILWRQCLLSALFLLVIKKSLSYECILLSFFKHRKIDWYVQKGHQFCQTETQILSCCPSNFQSKNWEVMQAVELFEASPFLIQDCFEVSNILPSFRVSMATCLYRRNTSHNPVVFTVL